MAVTTPAERKWANVATVTLVVGETKTAFHVHEAALFRASSFFKAAFTSRFRESSERTMTLPEDDESIFDLFVDWVYHGRYDTPPIPEQDEGDYDRWLQPVQLFVLADKYDVPTLKTHIITQLYLAFRQDRDPPPHQPTIVYAYEHTPQNSTLRKLLADALTDHFEIDWFESANTRTWLRNHLDILVGVIDSFDTGSLRWRSLEDYGEENNEYGLEGDVEESSESGAES